MSYNCQGERGPLFHSPSHSLYSSFLPNPPFSFSPPPSLVNRRVERSPMCRFLHSFFVKLVLVLTLFFLFQSNETLLWSQIPIEQVVSARLPHGWGDIWTPHTHTHFLKEQMLVKGLSSAHMILSSQRTEHCVERNGERTRITSLGRNSVIWTYYYCELNIIYLYWEILLLLKSRLFPHMILRVLLHSRCSGIDPLALWLSSILEKPFDGSLKGN